MGQRRFKPKEIIHTPRDTAIKSANGKMTGDVNLSISGADTLPDLSRTLKIAYI